MSELGSDMHTALSIIQRYVNNWENNRESFQLHEIRELVEAVDLWKRDALAILNRMSDTQSSENSRTLRNRNVQYNEASASYSAGNNGRKRKAATLDHSAALRRRSVATSSAVNGISHRPEENCDNLDEPENEQDGPSIIEEEIQPQRDDNTLIEDQEETDNSLFFPGRNDSPIQNDGVENFNELTWNDEQNEDHNVISQFDEAMAYTQNEPIDHLSYLGLIDQDPISSPEVSETSIQRYNHVDEKYYVDLAKQPNFRLPHKSTEEAVDNIDSEQCLNPLLHDEPLSPQLMHGLLFMLIPGPLKIFEGSEVLQHDLDTQELERFAVIVCHGGPPLVVLGNESQLLVIGEDEEPTFLEMFSSQWKRKYINPRIYKNIEPTLVTIYLAEEYFRGSDISTPNALKPPAAHELRLKFLRELMMPYETNVFLKRLGIPNSETASRRADVRAPDGSKELSTTDIPDIQEFGEDNLRKVFSKKPTNIKQKKCLRILQCVYEIGNPQILQSLVFTMGRPFEITPSSERGIDQLYDIHHYLDRHESNTHLAIARSRYVKFCYFQTYQLVAASLAERKRRGHQERHKVYTIKQTATFQHGLSELPPTPETDLMQRTYSSLTGPERERSASEVLKKEIINGIQTRFGGKSEDIGDRFTRYLREGKTMHLILQGASCLDPSLFILFPGQEHRAPLLDLSRCDAFTRSLSKPIKVQDIEALTECEARWFGKVLQITRPELMAPVPRAAFDLLSSSMTADALRYRNPDQYKNNPLQFFI